MKTDSFQRSEESAYGLALAGSAPAYNEAAFTYFLEIERRRSERSNRPFLLMLADLAPQPGSDARMDRAVASTVLSSLGRCLRDTDFVGWYLDQQVAGAVLTEHPAIHYEQAVTSLCQRVTRTLSRRLPKTVAGRLQLRVYHEIPQRGRTS